MPNQRAPDQTLLPFTAKVGFVQELDAGLRKLNLSNRSQFIRDAIAEKLYRAGIPLKDELRAAPPKFGKNRPLPRVNVSYKIPLKRKS